MKFIFPILFILCLFVLYNFNLTDWVILTLIIQTIWTSKLSNIIISDLNITEFKNTIKFNNFLICLLIADIIIIILSSSFIFRIIFSYLYFPLFFINLVLILISIVINFPIIYNKIKNENFSFFKKSIICICLLIYPIGPILISKKDLIK